MISFSNHGTDGAYISAYVEEKVYLGLFKAFHGYDILLMHNTLVSVLPRATVSILLLSWHEFYMI